MKLAHLPKPITIDVFSLCKMWTPVLHVVYLGKYQISSTWCTLKKFWKSNQHVFHFRLTPVYCVVMMIFVSLFTLWAKGPLYGENFPDADNCRDSWWTNITYLNNFIKIDKQVRNIYSMFILLNYCEFCCNVQLLGILHSDQ